jgi:hypothetical protein
MLCFEVAVNDEGPVIAGANNISVLSFTGTYVASNQDIELRVGGLISASQNDNEHIDWLHRSLKVGDKIVLRVVEASQASAAIARERTDPGFVEKQKREYFEQLKKEYGEAKEEPHPT